MSVRAFQNANVWFVRTLCSGLAAKLLGKSFLSPVAASGAASAACCTQHPVVDGSSRGVLCRAHEGTLNTLPLWEAEACDCCCENDFGNKAKLTAAESIDSSVKSVYDVP